MNCTQAQAMLAAYRELRTNKSDAIELDVHLEQCASCRQILAQYSLIGEQVRSLPMIEPPPTAYTKLMEALVAEHLRYIQRSGPGVQPTPMFLKPYLHEYTQYGHPTDPLVALSIADTGPLPIIRTPHKRRPRAHMSQFAVIGLAAAFLMVVMMSGLTTLLVLAHGNPRQAVIGNDGSSVHPPTAVIQVKYTTSTPYQHVVSAVADRSSIYYSAYDDETGPSWMLEQFDRSTKISTPLLPAASPSTLIVLGSANGWLVWLQFDFPKFVNNHNNLLNHDLPTFTRTWSLHYLSLTTPQQSDAPVPVQPETLVTGKFTQNSGWASTPVQGIWFVQNTLLVAMINANGTSHLLAYQLGATGRNVPTEIATADPNHIFTSPTANNDGTEIYWADEWRSDDGLLHSNIWTQQLLAAPRPAHGHWVAHTITIQQLFLTDESSFYPEVVGDTLFLLSTADTTSRPQTQVTPGTTSASTATSTPVPTSIPNPPLTSWADPNVYPAPLDTLVHGALLMLPLDSDPSTIPTQINTIGPAWLPQAGTNFVLWQSERGYQMYDVTTGTVSVGRVLEGARFLAVNGATTVWTLGDTTNTSNTTPTPNPLVTLLVFNWPDN